METKLSEIFSDLEYLDNCQDIKRKLEYLERLLKIAYLDGRMSVHKENLLK